MKLLNAAPLIHDNIAELIDFPDERNLPPYAILSHTWADEEVLFGDIALGPQHEVHPRLATLRASHHQASWSDDLDFSDAESLNSESADSVSLVSSGADAEPVDNSSQSGGPSTKQPMHDQRQRSVGGSPAKLIPSFDADLTQFPKQELRGAHVKLGWNKVLNTCLLACRDRLSYLSESTRCPRLDHRVPAAELTPSQLQLLQATNGRSRDTWLGPLAEDLVLNDCTRDSLRRSRWFTRGWTLQELIASGQTHFFDRSWQHIAKSTHLLHTLESITGIHLLGLLGEIQYFSVAQRMSWASKRTTTRVEDEAYCLLGIFGINMPLLYREGRKAFQRLQEEIVKISTDQSVFAWELRPWLNHGERDEAHSLLAPSTENFWWHAHDIESFRGWTDAAVQPTNEGARLQLPLYRWRQDHRCRNSIALLQCSTERLGSYMYVVGLRLQNPRADVHSYKVCKTEGSLHTRVEAEVVSTIEEREPTLRRLTRIAVNIDDYAKLTTHPLESLLISRNAPLDPRNPLLPPTFSIGLMLPPGGFRYQWRVAAAYPSTEWDAAGRTFELPVRQRSTFVAVYLEEMRGFRCFVVMGRMTDYHQSADASEQYGIWIFDRTAHFAIKESGHDRYEFCS
ncbi:hypothetical protein LTR37_017194 [Vermiconidia calcicola]|uniref:Uncharacterized protein n=1 Tax=Vermiconidia calcicola TaxID=1690605 RepID=A0ACC3MMA3_9PEZI|nr:hypothetical protein LTR37_017194 [Vermiconidia calcicola]